MASVSISAFAMQSAFTASADIGSAAMALVAIGSVFIGSAAIVLVLISSAKDGVAAIMRAPTATAAKPPARFFAKERELRKVLLRLSRPCEMPWSHRVIRRCEGRRYVFTGT